jgi:ParB/RepB/Spo0J family partition protein
MKAKPKEIRTVTGLVESGKVNVTKLDQARLPSFKVPQPSSGLISSGSTEVSSYLIQKIPLSKLRPSPYNARKFRTQERIQEIIDSLKTDGQREPITVYPGHGDNDGFYMIISGITRCQAARALRWDTLDARIDKSFNPDDVLSLVRLSHLHNDALPETDIDHAEVFRELTEQGISTDSIAQALGHKTPRKVHRLKHFHKLPKPIFELASSHPQKFYDYIAEELSKASAADALGEEIAFELALECLSQDYGLPKLKKRIEAEKKKLERNQGKHARAKKEINIPVSYGETKVGHFSVLSIPNSDRKRVQLTVDLPDNAADLLSEKLENLANELKSLGKNEPVHE